MSAEYGERAVELLARARRAFGGTQVREPIRRKAIAFFGRAPEVAALAGVDADLAQAAVDKLDRGTMPTKEELDALVASIRFVRGALRVQDDRILAPRDAQLSVATRAAIERWLPGVAAIRGVRGGCRVAIGTGFLVASRAMITAGHVVDHMAQATDVAAHFDFEHARPERRPKVRIRSVLALHPDEDVALLELEGDGPLAGVPIAPAPGAAPGQPIVVVGHPAKDGRCPPFLLPVFDDIYEVKRASPGEVMEAGLTRVYHDASTLGGNSGSPVFDGAGQVIAVHVSGEFADRNEAVSSAVLRSEPRIAARIDRWG